MVAAAALRPMIPSQTSRVMGGEMFTPRSRKPIPVRSGAALDDFTEGYSPLMDSDLLPKNLYPTPNPPPHSTEINVSDDNSDINDKQPLHLGRNWAHMVEPDVSPHDNDKEGGRDGLRNSGNGTHEHRRNLGDIVEEDKREEKRRRMEISNEKNKDLHNYDDFILVEVVDIEEVYRTCVRWVIHELPSSLLIMEKRQTSRMKALPQRNFILKMITRIGINR